MIDGPALIVFGGLPGTGKTTVARELTRRLAATYLRIDSIEQKLRSEGHAVGPMGYAIANALAAENLMLGGAGLLERSHRSMQMPTKLPRTESEE